MPYKKKIMQLLIGNPNIVNAIDSTKSDAPYELIWNNIFPTHNVTNINDGVTRVYITIDVFSPKVYDKTYKDVYVVFNVFAHDSKQQTGDGYCVVDYIQGEIDEMFNGNESFGIGYLELKSNNLIKVNDHYNGTSTAFVVTNFNRLEL